MKKAGAHLSAILLGGLCVAGCIKIKNTVRLNEDGSATVTEVVEYGRKLLTLEKQIDLGFKISDRVSKEGVRTRAAEMGKGVTVRDYRLTPLPDGGVRLQVVYYIPNINDLRLCLYPVGKDWNKYSMSFSHRADGARTPGLGLNVGFQNVGKHRLRVPGHSIQQVSELELQKVRKLLPVFKDMLEGFHLSLKIELYEREKWASFTKGAVGPSTPNWKRRGGRDTVFEVTDAMLCASDDALMILLPWRQEGGERAVTDLLRCPCFLPGLYRRLSYGWRFATYPHRREYW